MVPLEMRLSGAKFHSVHKSLKGTPRSTCQKASKCKGGSLPRARVMDPKVTMRHSQEHLAK